MTELTTEQALLVKTDEAARTAFIEKNEQLILKIASKASCHFVEKSDDEWSVALLAFSKAIDEYEENTGSFLGFAAMLIKHALVDEYRRNGKHVSEVTISPLALEGSEEIENAAEAQIAFEQLSRQQQESIDLASDLRLEMEEVNDKLKSFGFELVELLSCAPKQDKTRHECAKVISYLMNQVHTKENVLATGRLPVNEIRSRVKVCAKIMERYRKYILTAVVVLSGDYPYMADYLRELRPREMCG